MNHDELPKFGPPDAEGFRTVSFYDPEGAELTKISLHLERERRYCAKTSTDLDGQYSRKEQESLRAAATLLAAQKEAPEYDPERALAFILELMPQFIVANLEKHFPPFAHLALQAAKDACVKYTLNGLVQTWQGPRVYDDHDVDIILADLRKAVREFLSIDVGRPVETLDHLRRTREALKNLDDRKHLRASGKNPTQQQVAEELGIDARALRVWARSCGLSWSEWLRACGWDRKEIKMK